MSSLNIIASASLLAKDKHFNSHAEWIRNMSSLMQKQGALEKAWDGVVKGEAVKACIESSRFIAFCPYCQRPEAVDLQEKIFFCFGCNMLENDYQALPVEFPDTKTLNEIIAVLMERPMITKGGPTKYERIVRMVPEIVLRTGERILWLGRCWHHSQSVDDLRKEQDELIREWRIKKAEKV